MTVAIGQPALADDPRFADFASRGRNAEVLLPVLDDVFLTKTTEHWLTLLRAAGVPCGPVNSVAEALADAQTTAREMIVETDHPQFGTIRQVRSPVRVGSRTVEYRRAPRRDEDADYVRSAILGYDSDKIRRLMSDPSSPASDAAVTS